MNVEEMIEVGVSVFKNKMREFCEEAAGQDLSIESAEAMARGLQEALAAVGRETYRAYVESHETQEDFIRVNGEGYRYKYTKPKGVLTLFGPMKIRRRVYQNAADTDSYAPLEAALGFRKRKKDFMTVEVREAVALACAHMTPEEAAELLKKTALFHPHPTQIKSAVKAIGEDLREDQPEIDRRIRAEESVPEGTKALAASLDGVNVLLRDEEGGKRGRPAERPGLAQTQAKTTAYKNAMVGSVSFYGEAKELEKSPERLRSRYVSHMPEEGAPTFKAKFEAELDAAEANAPPEVKKVLIVDGARPLWNYIEAPRFDGYEKLIDCCHTLEHLSLAAEALFGKATPEAKDWYAKYVHKLLQCDDGGRRVLRSIDYHAKTRPLSKAQRRDLAQQRTFFARNHSRMTYADFRRRGLPIGSGPVEAACKTLVKTRLGRSGMRWTRPGGQRILDLRTYAKSNRWDNFWKHYKHTLNAA